MNLDDIETTTKADEAKLVTYLDAHAQAARIGAWVVVALNVAYAAKALVEADVLGCALGTVTAIVLFWMLVKTRPVAVA